MKKLALQIVLLAAAATQPLLAHADHERYDSRSRFNISQLSWRMGPDYGRGHEIYFRYPGDRDWRRAPGAAVDVGDGWVIGTDRRSGGFGIYRWSGNDWQRMPGAAVDIGGSYDNPWVVNDRGLRFHWTGYEWRADNNFSRRDERRDERRDDWRDERDRNNRGRDDNDWRNSWRNDERGTRDGSRSNADSRDDSGADNDRRDNDSHNDWDKR